MVGLSVSREIQVEPSAIQGQYGGHAGRFADDPVIALENRYGYNVTSTRGTSSANTICSPEEVPDQPVAILQLLPSLRI